MLPWEAKARTRDFPVDEVWPFLELLSAEAEVLSTTAGFGPDDIFMDEVDEACPICRGQGW